MFENLRDAFSSAAKSLGERELREKDIEDVLFQLEISLLESDVATEVIDSIKSDLKKKLIGTKVNKKEIEKFVKDSLIQTISSLFDSAGKIDIFSKIASKRDSGQPYIILFVGINGTGKTTTLAKLAYLLQKSKFSVVVAAADTFRAGAIEQLKEHTSRLNLKIVAQNYGSDPAAVARDAVLYAKSHKIDCVLVDTAGRMQTSKNLMDQITKIINVVKPDFKIFVGDSLAGNDTVNQAKEFHEHTKFDAAILTKSDADARGGAALSIVKVTSTPVIYVGVGQEYKDLKTFDKELFLETVFGKHDKNEISIAKEKVHETESKIDSKQVEETIPESQQESESPAIEEFSRDSRIPKEYDEIKSSKDSDPFEGLDTKDINLYADLFDAPPPENDQQAQELSVKIKKWISNGRPKAYDNPKEADTHNMKDDSEKPKKKHSLFGRFKK
jgi:fused signal recognition particle receptor